MGPARRVPGDDGRGTRDTGAAALEFALVAPLLLFLLFAIIGVGYGLFELQSARATVRDAARLAAFGIPEVTAYRRNVVCLGERNGGRPGALAEIDLGYFDDASAVTPTTAAAGKYVSVRLTYTSTLEGLPFVGRVFTDDDGHFSVATITRIEQVGLTDAVKTSQTITVDGEVCP